PTSQEIVGLLADRAAGWIIGAHHRMDSLFDCPRPWSQRESSRTWETSIRSLGRGLSAFLGHLAVISPFDAWAVKRALVGQDLTDTLPSVSRMCGRPWNTSARCRRPRRGGCLAVARPRPAGSGEAGQVRGRRGPRTIADWGRGRKAGDRGQRIPEAQNRK